MFNKLLQKQYLIIMGIVFMSGFLVLASQARATEQCGELITYTKDADNNVDDSKLFANVHSDDDNKTISTTGKNGYVVDSVEVDFVGGGTTYVLIGSGNLDHFNPTQGNTIDKYRVKVVKPCPTPTVPIEVTPEVTVEPTATPSATIEPTNVPPCNECGSDGRSDGRSDGGSSSPQPTLIPQAGWK